MSFVLQNQRPKFEAPVSAKALNKDRHSSDVAAKMTSRSCPAVLQHQAARLSSPRAVIPTKRCPHPSTPRKQTTTDRTSSSNNTYNQFRTQHLGANRTQRPRCKLGSWNVAQRTTTTTTTT